MDIPRIGIPLVLVLMVLTAASTALMKAGGLGPGRHALGAAARATGQLALVALLITAVAASQSQSAAFVAMMVVAAAVTAGHRVTGRALRGAGWAGLPILAGAGPVVALLLASGVIPPRPLAILPVAGIVIGGTMTAIALAGRQALDALRTRHGEYEAALALGLPPRAAALEICRPTAALALVPVLDQTRTVGLVTLPGAFVGVLLAGADPLQAGAAQLLILISLVTAEVIATLVTVELVAARRLRGPPPPP